MILKNKTAVFLGDSITEGVGVSNISNIYWSVLKRKFGLKKVTGYGISGSRYANQFKPSEDIKYDQNFLSRVDGMEEKADIIVVFGGTNDYGHGDAPLGGKDDKNSDTFYGACHELYCKLINKYPESLIVIATPLHRENENSLRGEGKKEKDVAPLSAYVDIIREVAEFYSLPVCDLYKMSGIQPYLPVMKNIYMPDGVHPNDKGHELIAERLGQFLRCL